MGAGPAKSELAEQSCEVAGLGLADREFDESNTAALRPRLQPRRRRSGKALRHLILEQNQRTQSVGRGADRGAGAKLVIENFQRQRAGIAGGPHRFHELGHWQVALSRETTKMPAPGQDVETEVWCARQWHQKNLAVG